MKIPAPGERTIVFIGGLHRSGTTVLTRLLADHAAVSGFSDTGVPEDEGEHLQSVYPDCWEYGGVGRFGNAEALHMTEDSALVSERARDMLWAEWSRWWDLRRQVLIEKSPPNMIKMRFLQALFPHARFILITRHPLAVVGATLKWRPRLVRGFEPHRLLEHWVRCHELAYADAPHIRRLSVIRYEDLIAEPAAVMAHLATFLDLDEPAPTHRVESHHSQTYFDAWNAQKRNPFRRPYLQWCERRSDAAVQRLGYTLQSPAPRPPAPDLQWLLPGDPARRIPDV